MFLRLFLLFTIIPIIELYLIIKIGGMIGALNTILIILTTAVIGAYLAKQQGLMVIRNIRQAVQEGRVPGRELLHGLIVLLGGLMLLTPGFITDIIGISALIPPIRGFYINLARKLILNKIESGDWRIGNTR
jgi:UPF0716 protein FxsA